MTVVPVRLWLLLAALAVAADAAAQTKARSTQPARRPGAKPAPAAPAVTDLKLDTLKNATAALPPTGRNPFRFAEPPVAVAASRPGRGNPRGGLPVPTPEVATGPPPPPPLPPIALRFIGLIEAPERAGRIALLSDGKGGLMNGREGDIIEGRYRVLRVGADSLDLAYADGRGRQTIRLSGQ